MSLPFFLFLLGFIFAEPSFFRCINNPTFGLSSYCNYTRSLCLDPLGLIVIDSNEAPGSNLSFSTEMGTPRYSGPKVAIQTIRYGESKGLPFRGHLHGRFENNSLLEKEVEWVPGRTLVVGFDSGGNNVYHFASKLMMGWFLQSRIIDDGETEPSALCSVFETVVLNRGMDGLSLWTKGMLEVVLGSPECTQYLSQSGKPLSVAGLVDKLTCFENAYTIGMDNALFSGTEDANKFQQRVWSSARVGSASLPFHGYIVYLKRNLFPPRAALNEEEIISIIEKETGRQVLVASTETMSFEEQVELFAYCGIFVSTHGSGLTNVIFMPQGGALIELNPWGFSFELYHYVAVASGHFYHRYVATRQDTEVPEMYQEVLKTFSVRNCMDSTCQSVARDLNFRVDPVVFTHLIRQANEEVFDKMKKN